MLDERPADERGMGEREGHRLGLVDIGRLCRRKPAPRIAGTVDELLPAAERLCPSFDLRLGRGFILHVAEAVGALLTVEPGQGLLTRRALLQSIDPEHLSL